MQVPGVIEARVSYDDEVARVSFSPQNPVRTGQLLRAVDAIGFKLTQK